MTSISSSIVLVAGCTGEDNEVKDSDGDGVIDSEDYAPNDPDVQEKSDAKSENGENQQNEQNTNQEDQQYPDLPSHDGKHRISGDDDYWSLELSIDKDFILEYTVVNELESSRDFDAFVFTDAEYKDYIGKLNGESRNPNAINEASAEEVNDRASISVELSSGDYYFVVDNTDIGDAGDFGDEATREVHVELVTKPL